jgi:hypothetical protein
MRWVTRHDAKVDRIACPWLIKRFVDPEAEFIYVPPDEVGRVAESGAIPYDVNGAKLGHQGRDCSFETIIKTYELRDPALSLLAGIVHGADVTADLAITPEAAGLNAIAEGFSALYGTRDLEKLAAELPVYDALYSWCQRRVGANAS